MSTPKSFRLPELLIARLTVLALKKHIKLSDAVRIAIERWVTDMEQEGAPVEPPRRKVLSRGVQ